MGCMGGWGDEKMEAVEVAEVWRLFLSLPVGHSKSEADKVILRAVHHRAADSFIASRLAVRAVDYNEGERERERRRERARAERH